MDVQDIALGAAFDVTAAVRLLAGQVVRLTVEVETLQARMAGQAGPGGQGDAVREGMLPAPAVEPLGLDLALLLPSLRLVQVLVNAGYTSVDQVRAASDLDLLAVNGIGPVALATIRKRLGEGV